MLSRRRFLKAAVASLLARRWATAADPLRGAAPLRITGLRVTPIALPDPPLLAASGCHGPYFLRNIVHLETDGRIVGVAETRGGQRATQALERAREVVVGQNAFAYRAFGKRLLDLGVAVYAGIEQACLDACGKATGRPLCQLLGGPVRDSVEFCAYLFYRFAADHPKLLADPHLVDARGKGKAALDDWGEVRTPEALAAEAERFRQRWGFRVFKLKAGVLPPKVELESMRALDAKFGGKLPLRIDPNARWKTETAIAAGKELRGVHLEYYEDPVKGQAAMAEVRKATGLRMSTNMCVTRFEHVPEAVKLHPVDVVLADLYYWGGFAGCLELGRLCETFGWSVSQHSNSHAGLSMAAMIHLGALCPQLTVASDTHYPWLPESADILQGLRPTFREGRLAVPAGPGLGVELDADRVARAHETYRKCGLRERDDAATMRLIEPGFRREDLY
jgi:glucarate dehydratase